MTVCLEVHHRGPDNNHWIFFIYQKFHKRVLWWFKVVAIISEFPRWHKRCAAEVRFCGFAVIKPPLFR